ncbi:heterokaryon incompatibility protein-domain-containing protein [Colletotrichum godetiae]|uniref:Heterokaryon incompatibility protein-domain-containing protein n=1 Tax=Colletotrichum godetiae TaxID=1209918 RepID=A0AAJ0EX92_9PEZI|nr:heterokaryon incompatibility protein-domain-containing protein [Colletotrichum godetiae]KAK1687416.1 heterokaryon incompatibility protein-domain-containing protein [Colletotrichum godetiae]
MILKPACVPVLPNEGHGTEPRNLSIEKSLYHALLALRHPAEQNTVWADAVCINGTDDIERSNHVAYMGPIYWNAARLAIWLGDDPRGHAKMAFDAIKPISEGHWNKKARKNLTRTDVDTFDTASWNAVAELYANSWFRHVWVQRDLGLSRKPFSTGEQLAQSVYWTCLVLIYGWIATMTLATASKISSSKTLPLSRTRATDPRDHIYGFLGHPSSRKRHAYGDSGNEDYMVNYCEDTSDPPILVADYTKPVDEVFLEVPQKLLQRHEDLRPLGAVFHTEDSLRFNLWVSLWDGAGEHFSAIGVIPMQHGTKIGYSHQPM